MPLFFIGPPLNSSLIPWTFSYYLRVCARAERQSFRLIPRPTSDLLFSIVRGLSLRPGYPERPCWSLHTDISHSSAPGMTISILKHQSRPLHLFIDLPVTPYGIFAIIAKHFLIYKQGSCPLDMNNKTPPPAPCLVSNTQMGCPFFFAFNFSFVRSGFRIPNSSNFRFKIKLLFPSGRSEMEPPFSPFLMLSAHLA